MPIAGWDAAGPLLNGWIGVDLFFVLSGFLITMCGILLRGRPVPVLRGPSFFVLAKFSYSLYLVHLPLIPALIRLVDGPLRLAETPAALRFIAFLPLFACASLLTAALLHYLVEKPFLLLKDRL